MKGVELLGRVPAGKGLGSGVGPVLDAWTRTNHQSSRISLDTFRVSPPPPQLRNTPSKITLGLSPPSRPARGKRGLRWLSPDPTETHGDQISEKGRESPC